MSERSAVQNPMLCYADAIGWTYISPEEAFKLRSSSYTLPSHRTQKLKSFANRRFRLSCFKLFWIAFTKLYIVSCFTRISALPQIKKSIERLVPFARTIYPDAAGSLPTMSRCRV